MKTNLINWSEVSRIICDDRTRIESDYSGKKYKKIVEKIKSVENELHKLLTEWV